MRLLNPALILGSLFALVSPAVASELGCPAAGSLTFTVPLSGSQFGGGQGSATGSGTAYLTFDPERDTLHIRASVTGIGDDIRGMTLLEFGQHKLDLTDLNNNFMNGTIDRTIFVLPAYLNDIIATPSRYSVVVRTGAFPDGAGAISGPLVPTQTFAGTFSGSAVVGTSGARAGGGAFTAQIVTKGDGSGDTLSYTIALSGAGDSFTSIELHQGSRGANGPLFVPLSNGGTFTNQAFSGTAFVTVDQTRQLTGLPTNFYVQVNTAAFPGGAARAQFGTAVTEEYFPIAGSAGGALGNRWQTDLGIFNESFSQPATVMIEMFPQGQANANGAGAMNPANVAAVTVPPRATRTLSNAVNSLFGLQTALGAIRAVSDQPVLTIERIYDDHAANGEAALTAQPVAGLSRCDAIAHGVIPGISGSGASGSVLALRSNAGFFNPNGFPVYVTLYLLDAGGASAGVQTVTLQPYEQIQTPLIAPGGLFTPEATITGGSLSYLASASIYAYVSVIDNRNSDAHITWAVEERTASGE